MTKQLFLHIGYPKTGTTALQHFFASNSATLLGNRVLYPATGRIGDAHYALNFSLRLCQYDQPHEIASAELLARDLHAEIEQADVDCALVSSEYFITARNLQPVREFFRNFDVKVIVYLRRHDHAFESVYNQSVRTSVLPPWEPNIESFILYELGQGTVPWDYLTVLRRWAAAFGTANIIVRPFERPQNTPSLFADFLRLIGVPMTDFVIPAKRKQNASLTAPIVSAIDAVQRSAAPKEVKQKIVGTLIQIDATIDRLAPARLLSPRLRGAIVARYINSYAVIAREFMGHANGVLFEEKLPDSNEAWSPPPALNNQQLTELLLRAACPHMPYDKPPP